MPLIVMCGYPSSGKSTNTQILVQYFKNNLGREVHVVDENSNFRGEKNDILDDSRKEKELRALVKSEAQRVLTKDKIVIVDSLNYIKGYRYELYCISKAVPTRQVTIHCDISEEMAWQWNCSRPEDEKYKREVFDHLIQRFELPDSQNRWDSPFFSVLPGESLDLDAVSNSLLSSRLPKQNQSTQCKPVSQSNYLSVMEKVTSDIVQVIVETQKQSSSIDEVHFSDTNTTVKLEEPVTLAKLNKLKRQFISLTKNSSVQGEIGPIFIQYINSQLTRRE